MSEQMKLPLNNQIVKGRITKHPLYTTWRAMMTGSTYRRGVVVCEEWQSFERFVLSVRVKPQNSKFTRLDQMGIWSPENCAWRIKGTGELIRIKTIANQQKEAFEDNRELARDTMHWKGNFERLRKALPQAIEHALSEKMKWTVLEEASKLAIRGNWLSAYNLIQRLF